jgi:hypothetical protein
MSARNLGTEATVVHDSIITAEMRSMVGVEVGPYVVDVEAGAVRRFREAVSGIMSHGSSSTPASSTYDIAAAPATLFCPDPIIASELCGLRRPQVFRYRIDGGSQWHFHHSVLAGDTLKLYSRIADIYEKQGSARTGRMLFTIIEVRCVNQRDELVGTAVGTAIAYEGAPSGNGEEHCQ